jgi:hypothetical protein
MHVSLPSISREGAAEAFAANLTSTIAEDVGIDGRAGHFERGIAASDPGYFGRLNMPHEVGAVTAACLAVEAKKFFAVGGFDDINLPVELNDVDLCLRLNERGWKTLFAPAARLIHRESASRGAGVLPDQRYGVQHAYFRARWLAVLRDDPYFHPGRSPPASPLTSYTSHWDKRRAARWRPVRVCDARRATGGLSRSWQERRKAAWTRSPRLAIGSLSKAGTAAR